MSCSDEHPTHVAQDGLIQISPKIKSKLQKAKYGVFNHSAVELCHWTKKSFSNAGNCYKHKFYGISTHRCMELTPTAMNCENRCVYCWRPTEFYDTLEMPLELVDEPDVIIEQLLRERKKLISGFYGHPKNDRNKLDESLLPEHYAISLSGEPTMYPKLPQMIRYLRQLPSTKSIFLVTNGQEPDMLQRLANEDSLPTQIYLSTNASNKEMYYRVNRPRYRDAWERWCKSLRLLSTITTRIVLRMTIIREYNDSMMFVNEFARIIQEGAPHFIELKSYMHVGMSTERLKASNMLEMAEIKSIAKQICLAVKGYEIMDESEISRIVVLQNQRRYINRWIESYLVNSQR